MELKRIIISILVLSMLFVNSLLIFAEETKEHDYPNGEFGEQSTSENNRSINPSINVPTAVI